MSRIKRITEKPITPFVVAAIVISLFALLVSGGTDRARAQTPGTPTPEPQVEQLGQLLDELKPSAYPNLDSSLNRIVEQDQAGQLTAHALAASVALHTDESLGVTLYVTKGHTQDVWDWLEESGASPRNIGADYIEAYVPVSLLAEASQREGVISVRTIIPARPSQGTIVSEGSTVHGVPAWHAAGIRGQGVKVGIIDSFEGFSRLMGTELPSDVQVRCYTDIGVHTPNLSDCERRSAHGTAVAEILFDIAPEATYYISNASTRGDFKTTVDWMIGQGVDFINISVTWSWDGSGNGTSPFSDSPLRTVDTAVANGIAVINAAGNRAAGTWFGSSHRTPLNPDFTFRFQIFDGNLDAFNCVHIDAGERLIVQLRWEGIWGAATRDLDLVLFTPNPVEIVESSNELQLGLPGDIPLEYLRYTSTVSGEYCLVVLHWNTNPSVPSWIQLGVLSSHTLEYNTQHHSIGNPAESANPGLLAVGATAWNDTHTIEWFSSQGPTPDGRIKPDIVGSDGVQTASRGATSFYGTSAAAPHVAGMAALVKQQFPAYSPSQVTAYLKNSAQPRGAKPNNTWGYGFARLPAPPTATPTATAVPSTPTPIPTATVVATPTPQPTGEPTPISTESPTPVATVEPTATAIPPTSTPITVPTATPEPTVPDDILNRLSAIETLLATIQGLVSALTDRIAAVEGRVAALEEDATSTEPTPTSTPISTQTVGPTATAVATATVAPTQVPTATVEPIPTPKPTVEPTPVPNPCRIFLPDDGSVPITINESWSAECVLPFQLSVVEAGDRYYRFVSFRATIAASWVANLESREDTVLVLYEWDDVNEQWTFVEMNDDVATGNTNSRIEWNATAEQGYYLAITTYKANTLGDFTLTLDATATSSQNSAPEQGFEPFDIPNPMRFDQRQ